MSKEQIMEKLIYFENKHGVVNPFIIREGEIIRLYTAPLTAEEKTKLEEFTNDDKNDENIFEFIPELDNKTGEIKIVDTIKFWEIPNGAISDYAIVARSQKYVVRRDNKVELVLENDIFEVWETRNSIYYYLNKGDLVRRRAIDGYSVDYKNGLRKLYRKVKNDDFSRNLVDKNDRELPHVR